MKVIWSNETDYHLRPLTRLVQIACEEIGWDPGRPLRVRLYYSSQGLSERADGQLVATRPYGLMGYAYVQSNHMALGVPNTYLSMRGKRERLDPARIPPERVAALAWHELGHCHGLRHPEMSREMMRALFEPERFAAKAAGISLTRSLQ